MTYLYIKTSSTVHVTLLDLAISEYCRFTCLLGFLRLAGLPRHISPIIHEYGSYISLTFFVCLTYTREDGRKEHHGACW